MQIRVTYSGSLRRRLTLSPRSGASFDCGTVGERGEEKGGSDGDDLRSEGFGGVDERLDESEEREEELRVDELEALFVREESVEEVEGEEANARRDVARILHSLLAQRDHRGAVVGAGEQPDEQRGQLQLDEAVDDGGGVLDEEEGDAEERLGGVLAEMAEEEPQVVGLHDDVEERICE